ncbi:unnamed protein product [Schistosoma margrebowiei]|uniref:Uncharacterized protein n=1 Tax=Schistosoma margrebowiei TaxID=48269 RepID=A0A183MDS7_9TREM|nr:unnamed protein product [Schistosoma margrebowiei]
MLIIVMIIIIVILMTRFNRHYISSYLIIWGINKGQLNTIHLNNNNNNNSKKGQTYACIHRTSEWNIHYSL